jgi:hypothetical protein
MSFDCALPRPGWRTRVPIKYMSFSTPKCQRRGLDWGVWSPKPALRTGRSRSLSRSTFTPKSDAIRPLNKPTN